MSFSAYVLLSYETVLQSDYWVQELERLLTVYPHQYYSIL